jgi:hypothetical protein
MIANAERDSKWYYTDHDNLVLKFGELFIKHIHDYDSGFTIKLSIYLGMLKDM